MADWTGQLKSTADARGVWMRADSLIEHIPSFPGEIDEVDTPRASDFDETEVTDTSNTPMALRNRGPVTDPPSPSRAKAPRKGPAPAPLYDEAPDPTEATPPTWDMGLLPATYADAEVTEEGDRPVAVDLTSLAKKAALVADQEQSVTLELLDDWMDHAEQLDIEAPQQQLLPHPSDPSPPVRSSLASRAPRAPRPAMAGHVPSANDLPSVPNRFAQALPNRTATPTPMRRDRALPNPNAFDSRAVTKPMARTPIRRLTPAPTPEPEGPSAFERAGWWAAGALSGMIGASVLASLMFAAVLLV